MTTVAEMVRAFKDVTKAEAVAVITRDVGAGMTAATELGHAAPGRVLLESDDATFLIQEVGRRGMLVVVMPPERAVSDLETAVARFVQAAAKDLD